MLYRIFSYLSVILIVSACLVGFSYNHKVRHLELGVIDYTEISTIEVIYTLALAKPTDTVFIHIHSPGGYVSLMQDIIYYINNTKATVICVLDTKAYSAAGVILMACPNRVIPDRGEIMVHQVQCPDEDPCNVTDYSRAYQLLKYYYGELLTVDEWVSINLGLEIYISGKEVKRRLEQ